MIVGGTIDYWQKRLNPWVFYFLNGTRHSQPPHPQPPTLVVEQDKMSSKFLLVNYVFSPNPILGSPIRVPVQVKLRKTGAHPPIKLCLLPKRPSGNFYSLQPPPPLIIIQKEILIRSYFGCFIFFPDLLPLFVDIAQEDEESFKTFAVYCGLALHHAKLYDKIRRSEQKYKVHRKTNLLFGWQDRYGGAV